MSLNLIGGMGSSCIILISILVGFLAYKSKKIHSDYNITYKETDNFRRASIAIQPNNSSIFSKQTTDEVISLGFQIMKRENYVMSKGVDWNGF